MRHRTKEPDHEFVDRVQRFETRFWQDADIRPLQFHALGIPLGVARDLETVERRQWLTGSASEPEKGVEREIGRVEIAPDHAPAWFCGQTEIDAHVGGRRSDVRRLELDVPD